MFKVYTLRGRMCGGTCALLFVGSLSVPLKIDCFDCLLYIGTRIRAYFENDMKYGFWFWRTNCAQVRGASEYVFLTQNSA